jgi:protein-disulfide isomerase
VKSLRRASALVLTLTLTGAPLLVAAKARRPQAAIKEQASAAKAFGEKNAPITMEVFSDFQCPACRALYLGAWRSLMDNYVVTGKVYLVHRYMVFPAHAYSRVATRYAEAAARIGKFEKVEDALFTKQDTWSQSGDVDGIVAAVLTSAEMAKVRQLVKSGQLDAAIDKDIALGQSQHVIQTPTTIISCKGQTYPVVGTVSYPVLRQFLDQLLSQR